MKKQILALFIVFGVAFAEESGLFVGGSVGIHNAKQEMTAKMTFISTGYTVYDNRSDSESDASFGLILGYKNMMQPHYGVRFYLNYDHNLLDITQESGKSETKSYEIVGINGDYLYDFSDAFGLFVGANLGLISWDKQMWSMEPSKDSDSWDAHFAVQFGLRGFSGRHSIELGVKIPLTSMSKSYTNPDSTELRNAIAQQGDNLADFNTHFEVKLKQQYNAFLRYVFSF